MGKVYIPAVEFLKKFEGKILIASHENPDGDTIGSALALYLFLKKIGKEVKVGCRDRVPYFLEFLPASRDYILLPTDEEFDLCIVVDASSAKRLGTEVKAKRFMRIDHHKGGDFYCECDLIDFSAPATAAVVYYLLYNLNGELIDRDIAVCIYTGLATDTGFFVNSNTTAEALRLASLLVERYGVDPHEVAVNVKERNPVRRLKLLSQVLKTLQLHLGGKVASIFVLKKWLENLGATYEDTEGFVNYARSIDGVEVAIFVIEKPEEGIWKVSLRSKGKADVSVVCEKFGGGGHKYAAGCKLPHNEGLEKVLNKLLKEIEKVLSTQEG
ncbi:MAG TPA: bifunctional oligoribonuclease/PAP phosphatase NrnA [Aquifex aeolicus]|uniref:Bifunctional oligoribonuclease/PAP phosphatase NrnA n=1 Tax=Aquifex aeolicus TaxID=63363 RepID=A0A9D1CGN3_AQUAO|nr:bifunctional oligoribonuclease/PAP phosphatase NrnA [Aquifex aeolicus]HIQ25897.1 bifunctional oligoribonuclease/PAP phosphatase NrnA [Aquifex aeolicus]